jgi:pre-mRNA-splicing factor CWC26
MAARGGWLKRARGAVHVIDEDEELRVKPAYAEDGDADVLEEIAAASAKRRRARPASSAAGRGESSSGKAANDDDDDDDDNRNVVDDILRVRSLLEFEELVSGSGAAPPSRAPEPAPAPAARARVEEDEDGDLRVAAPRAAPALPAAVAEDEDGDLVAPRPAAPVAEDEDGDLVPATREPQVEAPPPPRIQGLRSGADFDAEARQRMERDRESVRRLADAAEAEGGAAETVVRDRRGRVLTSLQKMMAEQQGRFVEDEETKMEWGKGLVQKREKAEDAEALARAAKAPFARRADDEELDAILRSRTRWGDPMEALRRARKEQASAEGEGDAATPSRVERPMYKGAPWPNRYNILPGYRWDGRDRSNGWEARRFLLINQRKAAAADAFKRASEDL